MELPNFCVSRTLLPSTLSVLALYLEAFMNPTWTCRCWWVRHYWWGFFTCSFLRVLVWFCFTFFTPTISNPWPQLASRFAAIAHLFYACVKFSSCLRCQQGLLELLHYLSIWSSPSHTWNSKVLLKWAIVLLFWLSSQVSFCLGISQSDLPRHHCFNFGQWYSAPQSSLWTKIE